MCYIISEVFFQKNILWQWKMRHNQTRSKSRSLLEFLFYLLYTNLYFMQTFIQFQYWYIGSFFLLKWKGAIPTNFSNNNVKWVGTEKNFDQNSTKNWNIVIFSFDALIRCRSHQLFIRWCQMRWNRDNSECLPSRERAWLRF